MARIPDDELHRIKTTIALERLVEARGITLKPHGKDRIGLCPFHDDHDPSLVITPSKNLYHCLGCGAGGSVIDWVMHTEGVSFRHAVELLQNDPSACAAKPSITQRSTTPKLDNPLDAEDDMTLMHQVIDYYHRALKQSPEALGYLEQRGLNNADLIDHFKLGYANRTLGYRLPEKNRKAGSEIRGQLQRLGLLRESGHEHFNGSLVIPIINDNKVLEVYGRKLNDNLRTGTPKHLYLPGPHKGIFNLEALGTAKEIILCESIIDALTFWNAGYRNVTTSYGTNGFTDELLQALIENNTERVLIAYDRDESGNTAASTLAAKLNQQNIDAYRIAFPKKMDANEYALQVTPASKSLGVVIRSAEWLGQGQPSAIQTQVKETVTDFNVEQQSEDKTMTTNNNNKKPSPKENEPPLAARAEPETVATEATVNDKDVTFNLGDRRYRVRGLDKNQNLNQLKVNILVSKEDALHVDSFDLYSAKARQHFIKQAAVELCLKEDIIKKDIGQLLLKLETLQEEKHNEQHSHDPIKAVLNPEDKQAALDLLHDKKLLTRILDDFNACGVIGEHTNLLVGYLAAVSRKLDKPLAIMVQSSSAAGKSSLMDAVLAMMPGEDKTQYSALTGQSLFYMGQTDLKNKILAIAEEEGAHNASYALKLLQSEGEVSIASTGKDEATGELVTREYRVEGPVMLFLTTTAIDIDEELLNRCLVLTVNETREQTQAIHQRQRQSRTLEGFTQKQHKKTILTQHQNAQRLLKPLAVINPYADQLTFLDSQTRTRRDHEKYLTLIDSIALLHQYQRDIKTITVNGADVEYIEVTLSDIETANRLAHDILGRTLDELPPQTRKLLTHIKAMVDAQCKQHAIEQSDVRFSRKMIRDYTGLGNTQLKIHCRRLEDMEYLLVHKGGRGQSFEYELLYDTNTVAQTQAHCMGLIDVKQLKQNNKKQDYDANRSGLKQNKSGPSRGQVGGMSGGTKTRKANPHATDSATGSEKQKKTTHYNNNGVESYPQPLAAHSTN